jgi:HlyD family secretion protein
VPVVTAGGTNKVETAENASPPLTGNEPPEVLMRRVREMRDRGEEPSPEIRAKMRELFQSGALQRTGQGGGPMGGGAGSRPRSAPAWRNIYVLTTNTPPGGGDPVLMPRPVRVRTGITDGSYTEITDGLQEGDTVITAVKLPTAQAAVQAPAGQSPFGGPPRMR